MKSVLIICFNNLKNDARVTRQINFLKSDYHVTVFCFDAYPDPTIDFYKVTKSRLTPFIKIISATVLILGLNEIAYAILHNYRKHVSVLAGKFDLILANDVETLPLAFEISAGKSKIFFDAHEFAPRQFEDRLYWKIFFQRFNNYLCKKYIPKVDGMSTINNGLAEAYENQFKIKPIIITNASEYVELKPKVLEQYPIRLVHHGIFNFSRQPEIMIDLMKKLDDRFTLDLIYLLPENSSQKTKKYFEEFKLKALETKKIKILPPLKGSEIVNFIHEHYDMGIILVPPINFNYENGLPNKLFDCIQARLGMVVGPLKEIASIISQYDIGIVSKDFTAHGMYLALNETSLEKVNKYKQQAHLTATQLNAAHNKTLLMETLKQII